MGIMIESPTEHFSAQIKKKDRNETIVDKLLGDNQSRNYFKKYIEIQGKAASGGKKW